MYILRNCGGQKLYQKTLEQAYSPFARESSVPACFCGAKGDYGEEAKKLLWVCAKNQRHWMNQQMANNEECESRLRQTEPADVAAGIGVRKT